MRKKRHGHTGIRYKSPTYYSWSKMKERCLNPNHDKYPNYGGRGIKVCERWLVFENFLADMGERPYGMTLDRVDNDKDYCKDNCRWATAKQQRSNQRRNKRCSFPEADAG